MKLSELLAGFLPLRNPIVCDPPDGVRGPFRFQKPLCTPFEGFKVQPAINEIEHRREVLPQADGGSSLVCTGVSAKFIEPRDTELTPRTPVTLKIAQL